VNVKKIGQIHNISKFQLAGIGRGLTGIQVVFAVKNANTPLIVSAAA
jgi:hypothetical protein